MSSAILLNIEGNWCREFRQEMVFCACVCPSAYVASVLTCLSLCLCLCLCPSENQPYSIDKTQHSFLSPINAAPQFVYKVTPLSVCFFFTSGRILSGCYWFCILIWVSTYTANLAAFLTVKNAHSPINNLEDIVKTSYQVAVLKSGIVNEFFKQSKYEAHKQIWQRIKGANSFFNSTTQAVEWLRQREEAVFIYDGPILSHIANRPPCDLMTGNSKTSCNVEMFLDALVKEAGGGGVKFRLPLPPGPRRLKKKARFR